MPAHVAQLFERYYRVPDHLFERLLTRAYIDAPIVPGHHAVLLYSPGLGDMRSDDTALEENLASDGFVVVAIDHTHEAQWVEFPDGRIVPWSVPYTSSSPYGFTPAVALRRVEDLSRICSSSSSSCQSWIAEIRCCAVRSISPGSGRSGSRWADRPRRTR